MGTNKFGVVLTLGLVALSFAEQASETITASVPAPHLVFGNTNPDLLWQSAMSAGFLLLPLVLILWMRRVALRDAVRDPTAAWFSYFKALQWCVNGTMLLWMVSRTSLLRGAQDLVAFRLPAGGWQPAIAHTLIVLVPPGSFICSVSFFLTRCWRIFAAIN